ncbi:DUF6056 family protein [Pseudorhodoferax sp.]|uniref:DUF6056 family protein n=1 Tax=Pseudorhodoferax sp. TaxID=1993553 RepID=UPI002DD644E7|nr:DUF6056 family protein [Pseudorhodoferax sp.]
MRLFWLAFVGLAWLVLQSHGPLGERNDDVYYAQALLKQSLWEWGAERYATWSGRVVIDALTVLLIRHVWLWRLLNVAMLALLLWVIAAHLRRERDLRLLLGLVLGFLLLDRVMVAESVWWMTGSFNYLWPAALGGFALLPFARPELPARVFWLSVPAAVYASFQEQTLALLLAFQCILGWRLVQQRLLRPWHGLQFAATLVCAAVLLRSPGAVRRYNAIMELWFPEYGLLNPAERLFSGLQLGLGHGLGGGAGWLVVLLLASLLCWSVWRRAGVSLFLRAVAVLPVLVLLGPPVFQFLYPSVIVANTHVDPMPSIAAWTRYSAATGGLDFPNFWIGNPVHRATPWLYAVVGSMLLTALALACALWSVFGGQRGGRWPGVLAVLVWFAALASTVVVGLTPSLYMSTQRIYYLQDLLTLGLAAAVFAQLTRAPAASAGGALR